MKKYRLEQLYRYLRQISATLLVPNEENELMLSSSDIFEEAVKTRGMFQLTHFELPLPTHDEIIEFVFEAIHHDAVRAFRLAWVASHFFSSATGKGLVGFFLESGIGYKDMKIAILYYELGAEGGDVLSMARLAFLRKYGTEQVFMNVAESKHWIQLLGQVESLWVFNAADYLGPAACAVGDCYYAGIGVPQSMTIAQRWYAKGAALSHPPAITGLALTSQTNQIELFIQAAALNEPRAMCYIADYLHKSGGNAEYWYRQAVQMDYPLAFYKLAVLYLENPQTWDRGILLLSRAAEDNVPQAMYKLASVWLQQPSPLSMPRALKLLSRAAEHGHAKAMFKLARIHEIQDPEKALLLYFCAAEHGHIGAHLSVARCLQHGVGCTVDLLGALHWIDGVFERIPLEEHAGFLEQMVPLAQFACMQLQKPHETLIAKAA